MTTIQQQAQDLGLPLTTTVTLNLPCGSTGADAWEWYTLLRDFFTAQSSSMGTVTIEPDRHDSSFYYITVFADRPRTDAELQALINNRQKRRQEEQAETRKQKQATERAERATYERLKKKYGGS